jgi:hypothetical protein
LRGRKLAITATAQICYGKKTGKQYIVYFSLGISITEEQHSNTNQKELKDYTLILGIVAPGRKSGGFINCSRTVHLAFDTT